MLEGGAALRQDKLRQFHFGVGDRGQVLDERVEDCKQPEASPRICEIEAEACRLEFHSELRLDGHDLDDAEVDLLDFELCLVKHDALERVEGGTEVTSASVQGLLVLILRSHFLLIILHAEHSEDVSAESEVPIQGLRLDLYEELLDAKGDLVVPDD